MATAGWDKHGGGGNPRGGCAGRAKDLRTASPGDVSGGPVLVVPTPMWVRGCTGPPMLLLGPLKGGGGDVVVPSPVPWGMGTWG